MISSNYVSTNIAVVKKESFDSHAGASEFEELIVVTSGYIWKMDLLLEIIVKPSPSGITAI